MTADIQDLIDNAINEDITYQSKPLDLRNQRTHAVKVSQEFGWLSATTNPGLSLVLMASLTLLGRRTEKPMQMLLKVL